ncbi:MAG: DUF1573 domain-containing protein [Bacteroidetes bacterium]|nr:DUF1573 domain-containing protein [Bacteroidota bacterium]
MKKFSLVLFLALLCSILVFFFIGCRPGNSSGKELSPGIIDNPASADSPANPGHMPVMTFETDEHDFGKLIQGEVVSYSFKFKNTGGSDLVISSVSSTCGCTVTDYPKDPVKSGKDGLVQVTFKSEGKRSFQHKTVTVMANTQPNTKVLRIKCEVRLPEETN